MKKFMEMEGVRYIDKKQETYGVYVGLLKIHKDFADIPPCRAEREKFIKRINTLNAQYNSLFCYGMCEALRKWFLKQFENMKKKDIPQLYADIWSFHKAWIGKKETDDDWEAIMKEVNVIKNAWGLSGCNDMLSEIVYELDASNSIK